MRVLVTGASGLLGSAMIKIFQNKFKVYATSKSDYLGIDRKILRNSILMKILIQNY